MSQSFEVKQMIEEFMEELDVGRPTNRPMAISNFKFTIKPEDDSWRIDEVRFALMFLHFLCIDATSIRQIVLWLLLS